MDIRHLRQVVALHDSGSFAAAAHQLGITQSALTRSLQQLEGQLKVRLFDRGRNGAVATEAGADLVREAREILLHVEEARRKVARRARGEAGVVRFGCGPLPAGVVLAGILSQVLATRPSVELVVRVDGAEPLLGELDEGRLDFVLMVRGRIDADNRDVSLTPIGPVRIAALARVGHPLAGRRCSSADLAAYPVIGGTLLPAEHERTRFVHQLVCDDYCALRAVTKATDAVWLAADCLADADLVELDCPDFGGEAQLVAAAKSGRTLSAAALAALAAARSTLAQVRRRPGAGPASQE